jgi:hypothetical protein
MKPKRPLWDWLHDDLRKDEVRNLKPKRRVKAWAVINPDANINLVKGGRGFGLLAIFGTKKHCLNQGVKHPIPVTITWHVPNREVGK